MHKIVLIETKLVIAFSAVLIIFNLVSLYFIIDFYGYDEVIAYLPGGEVKSCSPGTTMQLFFVLCMANLLYTSLSLMSRLLFK